MPKSTPRPPVIIIGSPSSGTTMLAGMVETMGLFMGNKKTVGREPKIMNALNNWILSQSGGRWDFPAPMHLFFENQKVEAQTVDYTRFILSTPRVISYLGIRKYLRYRSPFNLDIPWGWKDPRGTATLPVWLKLFPRAKVLHLVRHGADVASSLRRRFGRPHTRRRLMREIYYKVRPLHWVRPKRGNFVESVRCSILEESFTLWEEYLAVARQHMQGLGERGAEFRYEDILTKPEEALRAVARFCELPAGGSEIRRAAGQGRKERAFAYRRDPEVRAFAAKVAERLQAHGYEA
ncbi:sulfotransferase [Acidobacteriia bacterium AH_259_A11_L15]|nr:sulfotransferase [Acidobacteriia bacterium AH_259_A11_L15]